MWDWVREILRVLRTAELDDEELRALQREEDEANTWFTPEGYRVTQRYAGLGMRGPGDA